jgi:hypothetical protein
MPLPSRIMRAICGGLMLSAAMIRSASFSRSSSSLTMTGGPAQGRDGGGKPGKQGLLWV